MADNTVFDSVFKTMVHKAPQLLIPFINEVFGRSYPQDADIVQFNSEQQSPRGVRVEDSVFRISDKMYHVECQSTPDASMVVRMVEYDFDIALERALGEGAPYELDFPASCVLFLRHSANTPDVLTMKVNLPDGESFDYRVRVFKAQTVSREELFEKRLLLLLPFYLMRYERELAAIARDDGRAHELLRECSDLRLGLEETVLQLGDTVLYEELVELIIRVSDYLLEHEETLQKKVRAAMGGEVLELWHDRAERMEREARERGLEEGRAQGIEVGIEQGIERGRELGLSEGFDEGVNQMAEQLLALGTLDPAAIAQVKASLAKDVSSEGA